MSEKTVEKGYDKIARKYHEKRNKLDRRNELEQFASMLPKNAKILDAGCGSGVPVSKFLSDKGFEVTGVDISERMINLAKESVPKATFIKKDITRMKFPKDSFGGLVAFYSIIHIPREKHANLYKKFHEILKPESVMLVSLGSENWEATGKYHGETMFWSQYAPDKELKLLKEAGFEIIFGKKMTDGGETHFWVLAKNKK